MPAAVLAQVWRNPARQVRMVRVVRSDSVEVSALDESEAQAVGHLCGATSTTDVADASVALLARRLGAVVVTSDPDDLHRLDPGLVLVVC